MQDQRITSRLCRRAGTAWLCASVLFVTCPTRHSDAAPEYLATKHASCVRIRGNRLYRRPDHTLGYWHAEREAQRLLAGAQHRGDRTSDGLYRVGENLFVDVEIGDSTSLARVVADGSTYRMTREDGAAGPVIARQADGTWQFAEDGGNRARGSTLADVVPDTRTTDPLTLHRAAELVEWMGIDESRIDSLGQLPPSATENAVAEIAPAIMLSLDHAFFETLSTRLRTQSSTVWSGSEVHAIVDDIAAYIGRPLAFYGPDTATADIVVTPAGRLSPEAPIPDDAIGIVVRDGRFALRNGSGQDSQVEYESIFAAVAIAQRSRHDHRARSLADTDYAFRRELADSIDAGSSRRRHERAYDLVGSLDGFHPMQVGKIAKVLLLRQALFDTHHKLTSAEEALILQAAHGLLPEGHGLSIEVRHRQTGELLNRVGTDVPSPTPIVLFASLDTDGKRTTYYRRVPVPGNGPIPSRRIIDDPFSPIIDSLLNTDDGSLRKLIGLDEWDFRLFGERIMGRVAAGENALLPAPADRFIVRDPRVLADAREQVRDRWSLDGRHFVRLRHLDGRTQVVETRATESQGKFEILRPLTQMGEGRGTGLFVVQRDDLWYPASRSQGTSTAEVPGHRPLVRTYALPPQ